MADWEGRPTKYKIEYHLVWATQYRYGLLQRDLALRLLFEGRNLAKVYALGHSWFKCARSSVNDDGGLWRLGRSGPSFKRRGDWPVWIGFNGFGGVFRLAAALAHGGFTSNEDQADADRSATT